MDDESTSFEPKVPEPKITYEETPVITPISEQTPEAAQTEEQRSEKPMQESRIQEQQSENNPPTPKKRSMKSFIKGFFVFVLLFILGYALSGLIRNVINVPELSKVIPEKQEASSEATLVQTESTESGIYELSIPGASNIPVKQASDSAWKQYNPVHGTTRTPITTIQLKLPSTVLEPVCDGAGCGSQGTYLPGGTRLTIAPRGAGEVLADYRGKIISDASGKALVTKETTLGGKKATEYTTDTTGSTAGGYGFTMMHGYMIEVTDTLSFEINHFSPNGITTDFAADDALFKSIVATLTFSN